MIFKRTINKTSATYLIASYLLRVILRVYYGVFQMPHIVVSCDRNTAETRYRLQGWIKKL